MLTRVDQNFLAAVRRHCALIHADGAVEACDRIRNAGMEEPEIAALVTNWRQDGQIASLYRLADSLPDDLGETRSEILSDLSKAAQSADAYRRPLTRTMMSLEPLPVDPDLVEEPDWVQGRVDPAISKREEAPSPGM